MTTTVPLLSISDDNLNTHSYALCQDRQTYRSRLFKYPIEARFNKRKDNSPDISVDIAAVVLYEDFEYTGEMGGVGVDGRDDLYHSFRLFINTHQL